MRDVIFLSLYSCEDLGCQRLSVEARYGMQPQMIPMLISAMLGSSTLRQGDPWA